MKAIKYLLCALLMLSLVACGNANQSSGGNDTPKQPVALEEMYIQLFNEYGAEGTIVFCNEYLNGGSTELFPAYMHRIDASYYEAVKAAVNAFSFTTPTDDQTGTLIARVDIKKDFDMMYLNIYDNGVVSVRKHPEEVFFSVSQETIDSLIAAIKDSVVAYE